MEFAAKEFLMLALYASSTPDVDGCGDFVEVSLTVKPGIVPRVFLPRALHPWLYRLYREAS
jgi:hypothetical protein